MIRLDRQNRQSVASDGKTPSRPSLSYCSAASHHSARHGRTSGDTSAHTLLRRQAGNDYSANTLTGWPKRTESYSSNVSRGLTVRHRKGSWALGERDWWLIPPGS